MEIGSFPLIQLICRLCLYRVTFACYSTPCHVIGFTSSKNTNHYLYINTTHISSIYRNHKERTVCFPKTICFHTLVSIALCVKMICFRFGFFSLFDTFSICFFFYTLSVDTVRERGFQALVEVLSAFGFSTNALVGLPLT